MEGTLHSYETVYSPCLELRWIVPLLQLNLYSCSSLLSPIVDVQVELPRIDIAIDRCDVWARDFQTVAMDFTWAALQTQKTCRPVQARVRYKEIALRSMEADERFRWLEARVSSSLRPRGEDLRRMTVDEDNR